MDEGSAQADEQDVDEHISDLGERRQRKRDRATRVRRDSLPTGDGRLRPVGIPAVEDQLGQVAVTRLLTALDEQEFLRGRDGDRPHRGALDAVDTRTSTRQCGRDHGVVEAELQGCFDHIEQAWMLRRLAERSEDQALRWLIKTWRKAGVLDTDGQSLPRTRSGVRHPVTGTPPGGIMSPMLAHVSRLSGLCGSSHL